MHFLLSNVQIVSSKQYLKIYSKDTQELPYGLFPKCMLVRSSLLQTNIILYAFTTAMQLSINLLTFKI